MRTKSRGSHRACGALAAVCAAILPVMAEAQNAALDRIEAIERQIRGLQGELQHLKNELGEAKQQLRQSRSEAQRAREQAREAREAAERARQDTAKAAVAQAQATQAAAPVQAATAASPAAAAASQGVKVSMPEGRPIIATTDGRLSLAIGGLMQFDVGGYFQNPNKNTQFPELNDGVNLRRGRLYFVGKFDDLQSTSHPTSAVHPTGHQRCMKRTSTTPGSSR
jgi:TolA-binding protein